MLFHFIEYLKVAYWDRSKVGTLTCIYPPVKIPESYHKRNIN